MQPLRFGKTVLSPPTVILPLNHIQINPLKDDNQLYVEVDGRQQQVHSLDGLVYSVEDNALQAMNARGRQRRPAQAKLFRSIKKLLKAMKAQGWDISAWRRIQKSNRLMFLQIGGSGDGYLLADPGRRSRRSWQG